MAELFWQQEQSGVQPDSYPIRLGSLLQENSSVVPVLWGFPTHHTQHLLVILAVVMQLLQMSPTQLLCSLLR
jgi:hypothetical protein